MLDHEEMYNDLSPRLRDTLEERINSFGQKVRYKFNLARKNPDPTKYNGDIIYPSLYNLDPCTFKITDTLEDRQGKQKIKNIGIIKSIEKNDRGVSVFQFHRIRIPAIQKGILSFDLSKEEDKTFVAALELHPKNGNGLFPNPQMIPMFNRVDETKLATEKRAERSARKKAMDVVEAMSDKDIVQFADGMATDEWDSTQDIELLKNKLEELAETTPSLFNDLVAGKKMEYKAAIKRAIDSGVLSHNPATGSLSWSTTQQPIISLGMGFGDKTDIERFADWFMESGKRGDEAYAKIKSLAKKPVST